MSISRKVARNSMWLALESGFGAVSVLVTSVMLARHFGPAVLGNYNYLVWLTYVAGSLGTIGIPNMSQKYMAEYLGKGKPGVAYQIYRVAYGVQAAMALAMWVVGLLVVVVWGGHGWIGFWLVSAIVPRIIGFIPSQINMVTEEFHRNVTPAFIGNLTSVGVILASIWLDWGLLGLACSHMAGHSLELILKTVVTHDRLLQWRAVGGPPLDADIRRRMRTYAFHGIGLLVLNAVIWDRADLVLLKMLNNDPRQLSFFSYAFTMVDKLLLIPQAAGGALGLNLMTQYGRDRDRVTTMAVSSAVYLLLIGLPTLMGALALSGPVWLVYGARFAPAVPVFVAMAALAVPRVILLPAQSLLQATENQGFLLGWGSVCGAIKLGIGWLLIPGTGALGAALGNGMGQALTVLGAWAFIAWRFGPDLRLGCVARITASALVMTAVVSAVAHWLPPVLGLLAGLPAGALSYLTMLRLTSALSAVDRDRLLSLAHSFPVRLRNPLSTLLWALIPRTVEREPCVELSGN